MALLTGLFLMTSGVQKLTETVWTVKLAAGCEVDYHTTIGAVALACAQRGVDYMRLWPLPVVQPWQSTPDPVWGCVALNVGGYMFGSRWEELRATMRPFDIPIALVILAAGAWYVHHHVKNFRNASSLSGNEAAR